MKISVWLFERFGETEQAVSATKTRRPRFSMHRGRTWDSVGKLFDGTRIYADTTWGFYGYFEQGNQWYKFKLFC